MSRRVLLVLVLGVVVGAGIAVALSTDWLWFQELRYADVFLTMLGFRASLGLGVAAIVFLFVFLNLAWLARRRAPDVLWELDQPPLLAFETWLSRGLVPAVALLSAVAGLAASAHWETVVRFIYGVPFGSTDPLFGHDLSFFVFDLPFWWLLTSSATRVVAATTVLVFVVSAIRRSVAFTSRGPRIARGARSHLLWLVGLFLLLQAIEFWLDRFELVYSRRGFIFGAAYTDVHASLPVLNVLARVCLAVAAASFLQIWFRGLRLLAGGMAILVLAWVAGLGVYPAVVQRLRVTPNELAAERPFIERHIGMTRQAYALERIEEREFGAGEGLDAAALARNAATIRSIRLWDHRPLLQTYGQLQEIRTYYKFVDVDVDRYWLGGEYRQVMLSARELSYAHLRSPSWINEHLTFTHGYGLVAGPVNRVTEQGLPEFLASDIPPQVRGGFPAIRRPEIYYGDLATSYAIVRTRNRELDYPSGDENVYTEYGGRGGVPLSSWLRKALFAVRFGEVKILLSDDLTPESRMLMHRDIAGRVRRIAPFLRYDRDPYLIVTENGRLVWMLDAYTTTDRYPYADPTPGVGNYIRNSIKVTVDAYHGTVDFYLADAADPLARMLARAFPSLLKPLDAMPADLRRHIRYPEDLFAVQAAKYATYHMRDPQVFYNKEDLWMIPERSADGRRESMEPYSTIMRLPGERREEFILLTLFNPARRDNMIAWMAGRSDAPEYGRLIVYKFPKQRLVYGPRQIDARINQDPVIARQLALWNQSGSTVIRGSLLAIPIEDGLIYVQPLYLAATAQGALPELRRIIVAHGNEIAMEPTLERALASIFQTEPAGPGRSPDRRAVKEPATDQAPAALALGRQALEIWMRAQDALRRGDLAQYGAEQQRLEETLRAFVEATR